MGDVREYWVIQRVRNNKTDPFSYWHPEHGWVEAHQRKEYTEEETLEADRPLEGVWMFVREDTVLYEALTKMLAEEDESGEL